MEPLCISWLALSWQQELGISIGSTHRNEPVVPDLQNKWQTGWWWPPKIVEVNHSNRLSRTRSCVNANDDIKLDPIRVRSAILWAYVSPKCCLQSGLPNGTQRTREDYWIRMQHPDRVLNHFSLQQILEQKESWMPTECNFSVQVIVCQGLNGATHRAMSLLHSKSLLDTRYQTASNSFKQPRVKVLGVMCGRLETAEYLMLVTGNLFSELASRLYHPTRAWNSPSLDVSLLGDNNAWDFSSTI